MALHNEFGQFGEETACRYLIHKGYHLLSRNWRFHHLEIDIVAEWFGEVVFVEVKSRRNEDFMEAKAAVDLEKKENLLRAAHAYMNYYHLDQPFRFDIITVVGELPPFDVEQIVNAFTKAGVEETQRQRYHGHINEFQER